MRQSLLQRVRSSDYTNYAQQNNYPTSIFCALRYALGAMRSALRAMRFATQPYQRYRITTTLQYSNTPTLQHSNTPTLQPSQFLNYSTPALCALRYALCATRYALRAMRFATQPSQRYRITTTLQHLISLNN